MFLKKLGGESLENQTQKPLSVVDIIAYFNDPGLPALQRYYEEIKPYLYRATKFYERNQLKVVSQELSVAEKTLKSEISSVNSKEHNSQIYFGLGLIAEVLNDCKHAKGHYRKAIILNPFISDIVYDAWVRVADHGAGINFPQNFLDKIKTLFRDKQANINLKQLLVNLWQNQLHPRHALVLIWGRDTPILIGSIILTIWLSLLFQLERFNQLDPMIWTMLIMISVFLTFLASAAYWHWIRWDILVSAILIILIGIIFPLSLRLARHQSISNWGERAIQLVPDDDFRNNRQLGKQVLTRAEFRQLLNYQRKILDEEYHRSNDLPLDILPLVE